MDLEHVRILSTDKITLKNAKEAKNDPGIWLMCMYINRRSKT
jgi:hypothetical protein